MNIIFALLIAFMARAEIREAPSMVDALADIRPGDVVVFDIDNTLLETPQVLGSDQWYTANVAALVKSGLSEDQAGAIALKQWDQVQRITRVRTVEKITPHLVRSLQRLGVMTFALTARPVQLIETTLQQLDSQGIYFSSHGYRFHPAPDLRLRHGIIFIGINYYKGPVLNQFFAAQGLKPRRVIFIDDKIANVQSVESALAAAGIPSLEFRYGAADHEVQAYRADLAEVEWTYFLRHGGLISDTQAAQKLRGKVQSP